MVGAEAEAEANALRKRGVQLERRAQQLRSASKGISPPHVGTTPTPVEASVPQQHALPQGLLPRTQDPAGQVHNPPSTASELPAMQPQETQHRLERLSSQEGVGVDMAQQQLHGIASAAVLHQADASLATQSPLQLAASAPPPQQEQVPLAATGAVAAPEEVAQGMVAPLEASAQGSTLQGMVVWGNFKGWPAWPGLVTTEEEMDVAEVKGKKGQLLQGMQARSRLTDTISCS